VLVDRFHAAFAARVDVPQLSDPEPYLYDVPESDDTGKSNEQKDLSDTIYVIQIVSYETAFTARIRGH
jgi:hypothetical protein